MDGSLNDTRSVRPRFHAAALPMRPAKRQRHSATPLAAWASMSLRDGASGDRRSSGSAAPTPQEAEEEDCWSICFEELSDSKAAATPVCTQSFGRSCFDQHVADRAVGNVVIWPCVRVPCPLCRKSAQHASSMQVQAHVALQRGRAT